MTWAIGDLAICTNAYANVPVGTVLQVNYVGKNTLGFAPQIGLLSRGLYSKSRFVKAPPGTSPPVLETELTLDGLDLFMRKRIHFGYPGSMMASPRCVVWTSKGKP